MHSARNAAHNARIKRLFEVDFDIRNVISGNGSVKCTVASLSGAIGYYSAALGFEGVKVLAVDGYYPWQPEYPLWRSIDLVAKQSCPFIEFALSPAGQRIVRRQGYLPP